MTKPLVSVIIPTHNRSDKLIKAVESVIKQTYKNIEIIIIDDNSTDDTLEVIRKYIDENKDYSVIYHKNINNLGNAATRNVGIKMAKGEYVAFLDDDDIWLSEKLEKQVRLAQEENIKVVFCGTLWQEGKKIIKKTISDNKTVSFEHGGPTSTWLISRDVFDEVGLFDERFPSAVDGEFLVRLNKKYKSGHVREFLYIHYYYPDQISSSTTKKINGFSMLLEKHRNNFNKYELSSAALKLAIYRLFGGKKDFKMILLSILKKPSLKNIIILIFFIFPIRISRYFLNKLLDICKYPKSFAGRFN